MKGKDIEVKRNTPQKKLVKKTVKDICRNKYLYAIYKAMKEIGRNHSAVIVKMKIDDPYVIDINERNYILFLTYILGTIQGKSKDKIISRNDYINGEIYKNLDSNDDENIKKAYEKFVNLDGCKKCEEIEDSKNVRPDFVIHQSHDKVNNPRFYKDQKLIIEAKANKKIEEIPFFWDLLKLNYYIEQYNYDNAIYLIVNADVQKVGEYLALYDSKIGYYASDKKKLWFFVQNWNGKKFLSIELYQIENE